MSCWWTNIGHGTGYQAKKIPVPATKPADIYTLIIMIKNAMITQFVYTLNHVLNISVITTVNPLFPSLEVVHVAVTDYISVTGIERSATVIYWYFSCRSMTVTQTALTEVHHSLTGGRREALRMHI